MSGYNGAFSGTPTVRATAAHNTAFRGIALAPVAVPEPGAALFGGALCGVFGVVAVGRRLVGIAVAQASVRRNS